MLFLLDTNVLIDANRDYYALDRVPEFWDWLVHFGTEGQVKMYLDWVMGKAGQKLVSELGFVPLH